MEYLLTILVLILSIPIGLYLKKITKEEMKQGKKYFKIIWIASVIGALMVWFFPIEMFLKQTLFFSFLFIGTVGWISWRK